MSARSLETPSALLSIATDFADQATVLAAKAITRLPNVPAAFLGIVLVLQVLAMLGAPPRLLGETLMVAATIVWIVVVTLYGLKWVLRRQEAIGEALHPVQCCFIGLGGVSTMLISLALLPYTRPIATVLLVAGGASTLGFAVWRTGILWQTGRDPAASTPVLYLPAVAGGFVGAAASAAFGFPDWGQLAFGASLLTWMAIESVLLHRLYTLPEMPVALRSTLGIQLAPPAVGSVAYYAVNGGHADFILNALLGYGILQAMILLRLLPWLLKQPFAASYWAYTFGAVALTTAPLRMIARGETGPATQIAPVLFVMANIVVGSVAIGTIQLLFQGRLLPNAAPAR